MEWQALPVEGVGDEEDTLTDWKYCKLPDGLHYLRFKLPGDPGKRHIPPGILCTALIIWFSECSLSRPSIVNLNLFHKPCTTLKKKNPKKHKKNILAIDPSLCRTSARATSKLIFSATDVPVLLFAKSRISTNTRPHGFMPVIFIVPAPNCVWYPLSNHIPNVENFTSSKEKRGRGEWIN